MRRTLRCRLDPAGQIAADGAPDTWRATGADPNFRLWPPEGRKRHRGGWVRIRADLTALDRAKLTPLLYVDDGKGFRETLTIPLERDASGIDNLVRLPRRVRGLRLDPMSGVGRFRLGHVSLTYLGSLGAVSEIARRLVARLPEGERAPRQLVARLARFARGKGLSELWSDFLASARPRPVPASYKAWIDTVETPARPSVEAMRAEIAGFDSRPRISIVMPVYNTPKRWLAAAIASVQAQAYEDWELCLCDDNSSEPHIWPMLQAYAAADPRIKLHRRTRNGRISAASNDAMALATGSHLTLMDHDDAIPENALYEFVAVLNADPSVDFIYSDEDKVSIDGVRYEPFFKPDWSPEALEACMYTAHLALYRMDIVARIGGFRDACNGAQDYDFVLRYTEHVRNVVHVPKVLYHWRAIPGSTAQTMDNKDYVIAAAIRGLEDRARRTGELDFARASAFKGCFELRRKLTQRPLVSIVIPSAGRDSVVGGRSVDLLAACLDSVRGASTYESIEVVVVDNGDLRPGTRAALERHGAKRVTYADPVFNVAAKMNLGAEAAGGEVLVFLNDDITVITPDWIEAMLALLQIPGVGAVGPKLLFETGEIQHAGVSVIDATPDHVRRGYPGDDPGHFFSTVGNRNYLAVTGACVMLRRADFEAVGGFDAGFAVNYNDVDLCLRLWDRGLRIVYCAQASLHHYESRNRARTVDPEEHRRFRDRWARKLPRDPYYGEWFEALPPTFELDPARF
ncbi:glycosyltransferase family 2 protein [Methylobacterium sp. J-068]|uniref:glycosyltransferase family 2 protein n=1 Tax=Methylobacterium sp. J-068 TaxID=2836649 RepID=UPI001FBBE873|nr:glycosyltransferase family 2 protein [Methylobacterium sp. J-068]MCJ2033710.1 glycosyltransferase family 2 protein [Methylobacterium sp. J-068]